MNYVGYSQPDWSTFRPSSPRYLIEDPLPCNAFDRAVMVTFPNTLSGEDMVPLIEECRKQMKIINDIIDEAVLKMEEAKANGV